VTVAVETAAIELRHVTKSFGTLRVLDDVCLSISTGRSVCVLGRSGTGKAWRCSTRSVWPKTWEFPLRRHTNLLDEDVRSRAREYDKMPADMSGGMRKRVGSAHALALEPANLLADEPSAGLDLVTVREIDELLVEFKVRSTTTLVVVAHNIPSARTIGDELVFLHEGRVIARGARHSTGATSPRAPIHDV
jgi:ABC-type transporter Mla maintaining outer membrane lipid asymmetry ATPase subunit MlaF